MNFHMTAPLASASMPLPASMILAQLATATFKNLEQGRRHPADIYALAIRTVAESFDDAMSDYDAVVLRGEGNALSPALQKAVVKSLDHLLDAIAEHFEDAKCCLHLVLGDLPEKQITKHLREYDETIRTARAFCTTQVNEMKHRQGRLQLIHVAFADSVLWGYFIQGVGSDGDIGPNPNVHKTNTAYSFGRAFRMLALAVLFTSKALATAICRSPTYRLSQGQGGFGPLQPLIERLSAMPRVVFWDEIQGCPDFQIGSEVVEVRMPATRRWKRPPQDSRLHMTFLAETHASSFRLPYMGDYMATSRPPMPAGKAKK